MRARIVGTRLHSYRSNRIDHNLSSAILVNSNLPAMPARRLEDRIREIASRIAVSMNDELSDLLADLQRAIPEYALRVQNKTTATVLAWPEFPRDRRRASV